MTTEGTIASVTLLPTPTEQPMRETHKAPKTDKARSHKPDGTRAAGCANDMAHERGSRSNRSLEPETSTRSHGKHGRQRSRLPEWFRVPLPAGERYRELKRSLRGLGLATVCEEARCPNLAECWSSGTATLMILGDVCTRGCRFCAVKTGNPRGKLNTNEPESAALAVEAMARESQVSYIVITSVDRDDMEDLGAGHYAGCIEAVRRRMPEIGIEVLTPDFQGRREAIRAIARARPDVFAHNIETVSRLHRRVRDVRASYRQSLSVLRMALEEGISLTKSGLMVGHGESKEELLEAMADLREAGTELLTIGQYLQPTARHLPVERIWTPRELDELASEGKRMGFLHVTSGPLVRSSYRAGEHFKDAIVSRSPTRRGGP